MIAGQVCPWLRYQGGQPCHEVAGFEDDVRGAVPIRRLEGIANVAAVGEREPLGGDRRAGDVAGQTLELLSLPAFGANAGSRLTGLERKANILPAGAVKVTVSV